MLGRLLKYELKATARIFIPIYLIVIAANLIYLLGQSAGDDYIVAKVIMTIAISLGYVATLMVWLYTAVGRFYQSMFTDEGYLTHSLPVSVHRLIVSKLMISIFWYLFGAAMFTFFTKYAYYYTPDGNFVLQITSSYIVLSFISSTESLIMFSMLIYASLSIVQMFHTVKNKFLISALIVIAASIFYFLLMNRLEILFPNVFKSVFEAVGGASEFEAAVRHFLSPRFLLDLTLIFVLYFTTSWCLKHRLNLE